MKDRQHFFRPLLPAQPFVFDAGANYGEYTAAFFSLGARKVLAVEPQQELAQFICEAFASELQSGRLVVQTQAIGARPGVAHLYNAPDADRRMATLSTVFVEVARDRKWDNEGTEVSVTTLDDLIKEYGIPDYVKIDVEGFDLEVLNGLSSRFHSFLSNIIHNLLSLILRKDA